MKSKSLLFVGASVLLAAAMISCGQKQETETAAPAGNPAGKAVDAATAGTVSGTIKLDGTAPKMKNINMAAEPNCSKLHTDSPAQTEDVVVGDGNTLANVFVYLSGDFSAYNLPVISTAGVIDQKGCQYHPHVLGLMVGQALNVTNSDMTTHNIHPVPKNNREWNQSQPPGASPIMQSFAHEEVAIPVKCNVHPWMKAYIAVLGTPYFMVTGKDGQYTIGNVPPGTYTLTAWHEMYGPTTQMVTVGPSEKKTVDLMVKATGS